MEVKLFRINPIYYTKEYVSLLFITQLILRAPIGNIRHVKCMFHFHMLKNVEKKESPFDSISLFFPLFSISLHISVSLSLITPFLSHCRWTHMPPISLLSSSLSLAVTIFLSFSFWSTSIGGVNTLQLLFYNLNHSKFTMFGFVNLKKLANYGTIHRLKKIYTMLIYCCV